MSCTNMSKLLVIGGGITSSVSTLALSQKLKNVEIKVWDKARGAGGRMSTSRSPGNPQCIADLGAQYISTKPEFYENHKKYYDQLLSKNLIQKYGKVKNEHDGKGVNQFVAVHGTASIVKHFFNESGINVNFQTHVDQVTINSNNKLEFKTKDGKSEVFDSAILTMPVPQILQLPGMDQILDSTMKEKLSKVSYLARYALGLFFDKPTELSGIEVSKYIKDDDTLVFVSNDPLKRGQAKDTSATSVVIMTTTDWGQKYLETPIPEVKKILIEHCKQKYPDWPDPVSTKCQRWRYSQVLEPFEGNPLAVILNENPLIVAGGDGFTGKFASVDSCIASALKISELVTKSSS